ncbi:MAG: ABC transporter permease subunit [Rhodospirillales bacterium]
MTVEAATIDSGTSNPLLRLWRNKETRGVIIQIATIAAIFAFIAWLVTNAIANLEELGKGFSFSFLWDASNYDIGFSPFIDFNSQSPHLTAALVGLQNTLLVAVWGVVLATILGFIIGVLRLSKNFLMNRLAYCYVELIRNVPVLLWILLVHGAVVGNLPQIRDFRGLEGLEDMNFFFTNRGLYMPAPEFQPLAWAAFAAFIAGIVGAYMYAKRAKAKQEATGEISPVLWVSVGLIVGLPVVVFVVTGLPWEWSSPELKGFNFQGGFVIKPEFMALWLALSIYTSSFIAEIVRAGIQAVSHGQTEAAHALGLRHNRALQLVIIPQALRVIVPPLTSQYLNLTKNSSLAIAIGYYDLVATIGGISLNQTGREMECMIIVLLTYLTISLLISAFMNWYNNRIKLVER